SCFPHRHVTFIDHSFFFSYYPPHRHLHSFPTRRSSDLDLWDNPLGTDGFEFIEYAAPDPAALGRLFVHMGFTAVAKHRSKNVLRSEEHTSELQSRSDLVCRLLLEKKKNKT